MKGPRLWCRNFVNDESGQDIIEYALIGAVIGLAVVASMQSVQTSITKVFNGVSNNL